MIEVGQQPPGADQGQVARPDVLGPGGDQVRHSEVVLEECERDEHQRRPGGGGTGGPPVPLPGGRQDRRPAEEHQRRVLSGGQPRGQSRQSVPPVPVRDDRDQGQRPTEHLRAGPRQIPDDRPDRGQGRQGQALPDRGGRPEHREPDREGEPRGVGQIQGREFAPSGPSEVLLGRDGGQGVGPEVDAVHPAIRGGRVGVGFDRGRPQAEAVGLAVDRRHVLRPQLRGRVTVERLGLIPVLPGVAVDAVRYLPGLVSQQEHGPDDEGHDRDGAKPPPSSTAGRGRSLVAWHSRSRWMMRTSQRRADRLSLVGWVKLCGADPP